MGVLAVALGLGFAMPDANAQQVTVTNQGNSTAKGAGAIGTPSLTITIPTGDNRAIFILPSFEREHCSTADDAAGGCVSGSSSIGDNHVSSATTTASNQMTIRIAGPGGTINKINPLVLPDGDLRFMRISVNISTTSEIPYLTLENFHYALYESEIETLLGGAASGSVTITLPNARTPKSGGDDASLMAVVFENVNESNTGIVRNGTVFASTAPEPGNVVLSNTDLDAGQEVVDPKDGFIVYGASFVGGPTAMGFDTMPGFTELFDYTTTNSNGHLPNSVTKYNETDGLTMGMQFRSGPSSGTIDSFSLQGSGSAAIQSFGSLAASFKIDYARADLELEKVVTSGLPRIGEDITFRVTVTNDGPDNANLVRALDSLPSGYSYVSHTTSQGTYTPATGVWDIGYVHDQASVTLDVVATVLASGDYTNRAEITNSSIFDPDSTPNDNGGDDASSVSVTPAASLRDYGDAPVSGTAPSGSGTNSYGKASHVIGTLRLGANIDIDDGNLASTDANGDDTDGSDDEDGISAFPSLSVGDLAYTIPAANISGSGTGELHAWIDFDGDGSFASTEYAATAINLGVVANDLAWTNIQTGNLAQTFGRFRFTSDTGVTAMTPAGQASNGEVEDHALAVQLPPPNYVTDVTDGQVCVALGGTLSGTNIFTDFDGGTFGTGTGAMDETPAVNPYPGKILGGTYDSYYDMGHGEYSIVSNIVTPRNAAQHGDGIYDPIDGPGGRFFASDPDTDTPRFTTTVTGLTPGKTYEITFWAANSEPSTAGNYNRIAVFADGAEVYNTGFLQPSTPMTWKKYSYLYIVDDASTSATFEIRSTETGASGHDFFLDAVGFEECTPPPDFSDAPSSYGDAFHLRFDDTILLGSTVTSEIAGYDDPEADADAGDDGVVIPSLVPGGSGDIVVTTVGTGFLQAWIDWDDSGTFDSPSEQIATDMQDFGTGTITIPVTMPTWATPSRKFARFRWSNDFAIGASGLALDGEVEDYSFLPGGGAVISGRVFIDNGVGGGMAHNAVLDGTEVGTPEATIDVFETAGNTLVATATIDAMGNWSARLPEGFTGEVRVVTVPGAGLRTISEQTTGLPVLVNADPHDGTFAFTPVQGVAYSGIDIGLIAEPLLSQDQVANLTPGQVALLSHQYVATTTASVQFSIIGSTSNPADTFTTTLFEDTDCDGLPDAAISGPRAVVSGETVCLLARTQASNGISPSANATYSIQAVTTFASTAVTSTLVNTDAINGGATGEMVLRKLVRNTSQVGAQESTQNSGNIGDVLQYRIIMSNPGQGPASNLAVYDSTPVYTALNTPIVSPVAVASGVTCTLVVPVAGSNTSGYRGPLEWNCPGQFAPGETGSVTFDVTILP